MSITGSNIGLSFIYRVSSFKIKLTVWKFKAGNLHRATFITTKTKYNHVFVPLDSSVEAVQLVADKYGVTKNVEYILVNSLQLAEAPDIPQGTSFTVALPVCYVCLGHQSGIATKKNGHRCSWYPVISKFVN